MLPVYAILSVFDPLRNYEITITPLPKRRQTLCFSATMEQSVPGLINDYVHDPVRVALGSVLKPAESIQLKAYEVGPGEKPDVLGQLL